MVKNFKDMIKKIKIWWIHFMFSINYPVKYTEPVTWLSEFTSYLDNINKLKNK